MPKISDLHPHSDRTSFNRLMLLISAIANNPGIGISGVGGSPVGEILEAMKAIALALDIEWQEWSENTIRADLKTLREYGILRSGTTLRNGYYLGSNPPKLPKVTRAQRPLKSKLDPQQIVKLRDDGRSLADVAKLAGISREAVRRLEKKGREVIDDRP